MLYTNIMYFSSWFDRQVITLLFFLTSPRTLAYNFYSYLEYLFIYLASQHVFLLFF